MIDTHCHLSFPDFAGRIDEELAAAAALGVTGAITICTTTQDCLDLLTIVEAHERVWCSAGVHPLYADRTPHDWARLRLVTAHPRCVAWGELGLDNHYDRPPAELQRAVLEEQLGFIESCHADGVGGEGGLPVVVHCRDAFDDVIAVLRRTRLDPSRFVFHCFTGGPADARKVLEFGAWISFTGVVTYRNAPDVRHAAEIVPADRIMVETDAPFLSPAPHRGKRPCRPAWVRHTAEALAELRAVPFEAFHQQLNDNTRRFFGIDAR